MHFSGVEVRETVETVAGIPGLANTQLKQGVNERGSGLPFLTALKHGVNERGRGTQR